MSLIRAKPHRTTPVENMLPLVGGVLWSAIYAPHTTPYVLPEYASPGSSLGLSGTVTCRH